RRPERTPAPSPSTEGHFLQELDVIERLAAAEDDRADRVVAHHDGQPRLLAEEDVEVLQERATAREHDALVADVGRELGRRALEGDEDRLDDRVDRLLERLADLVARDDDRLRDARDEIAALDLHRERLLEGVRVARGDLDALGRLLADRHVVLAL